MTKNGEKILQNMKVALQLFVVFVAVSACFNFKMVHSTSVEVKKIELEERG
jgi:hypothetical protein